MLIPALQVCKLKFRLTQCVARPGFDVRFSLLYYSYNQTSIIGWSVPFFLGGTVCQHLRSVQQQHNWALMLGYMNCPLLEVRNSTLCQLSKMPLLQNPPEYVEFIFPFHYMCGKIWKRRPITVLCRITFRIICDQRCW